MITVSGRPRRNWDCSVRHTEGQILVRLDDRDDPAFWIEILCDWEDTEGFLADLLMWLQNTAIVLDVSRN